MKGSESPHYRRLLRPGNTNCGGCGMSVAFQMFRRSIGETNIQLVIPACCAAVAAGGFPYNAYEAPVLLSTFASAASTASGMAQVARLNGENTRVVCWAGDGGTYDIGLASLSGAAERNEDILFVCYDNEIYGNTGGQRSSATPVGAGASNIIKGKLEPKKDIMGIMAAHGIPYAATISLANPDDSKRKFERALREKGFRFLLILAPCPTGWKSDPSKTVELVRLAVRSGLYPVIEIENGRRWIINIEPDFSRADLELYLSLQRRFKKSEIRPDDMRRAIDVLWEKLRALAGCIT
ncbi:MAG: thiamine pyrophosphate-dependent enzyme [Deltaproteobacteria bacterium]|nr:thiamine pyrophosphate-dependent enzyme [Deltaproteobacteria bacterium]